MATAAPCEDAISALRAVVGDAHARAAEAADAIDGVFPRVVVEPGSVEEVSAVLRGARALGLAVVPRGSGTKLHWGAPPRRADLVLATSRLDRVLEHAAGDLVVTAQAGVRLATLQEVLAGAGQRLALDPPEPGATLGGIVAAGASGPCRHRFGTARDLLIGIRVVLADGTVAKAGGKVVKNVAGYDLGKLFTGSLGTLGVVVETTFRLHPRPADRLLVRQGLETPEAAGAAVQALLHSSLVPSAVELLWPAEAGSGTLAVLFEGSPRSAISQAEAAASRLGGRGTILADEALELEWEKTTAHPFAAADLGLKASAPPSDLPRVLRAVMTAAGKRSLGARMSGRAGTGVLHVGVTSGDAEAHASLLAELRQVLLPFGASVVVVQASPELKRRVDVWGPVGALPLMRRVKAQFDPDGRLAPGRFVGGI
jgi:glycolate dehydrogenase FAD-binding subunit